MAPWRLVVLLALTANALAAQRERTIAVGDTVRDSLTRHDPLLPAESTYAQQWRLAGRAGQTVTIDLTADAFDAYAFLLGPDRTRWCWVGDRLSDVEPARRLGGRALLVETGGGATHVGKARALRIPVVADLAAAAAEIVRGV